jgi:hypothetical protein
MAKSIDEAIRLLRSNRDITGRISRLDGACYLALDAEQLAEADRIEESFAKWSRVFNPLPAYH